MIVVALGGNLTGKKGTPVQTMQWAIREMKKYRIYVISVSSFYSTRAIGQKGQADYVNAVVLVQTALSAVNLLKSLKLIEMTAGRNNRKSRMAERWGPRPLDLDIVDYKGLVSKGYHVSSGEYPVTHGGNVEKSELVLPHPRAHQRPFVIGPLVDVAPFWHHPVHGLSAISLWAMLQRRALQGQILNRLLVEPVRV